MRLKALGIVVCFLLLLSGCAGLPHVIGYEIVKEPASAAGLGKVFILPFDEERPEPERKGAKGKLLKFSSKDAHFSKTVPEAIKEILSAELSSAGFSVVENQEGCDWKIAGSVKHFQAIMAPAKITFLPYLGSVSTLWAKDDFTIALSIDIKMTDKKGTIVIDKPFRVCEDMEIRTGLLNLARYSRGFNYKLKLLDEALKDVMEQIRREIVSKVKEKG